MQTLTALFIMALAPLAAGFGAFTEDPANYANKHIPGCISAPEHVSKEPTAWSSHPACGAWARGCIRLGLKGHARYTHQGPHACTRQPQSSLTRSPSCRRFLP